MALSFVTGPYISYILDGMGVYPQGLQKQGNRAKFPSAAPGDLPSLWAGQVCSTIKPVEIDRCEKGKGCCSLRLLEMSQTFLMESHFLRSKSQVCKMVYQWIIETAINKITRLGHECLFYPKFHCKFDDIEFFWGAAKRHTRENCNYSFVGLEPIVLAGLESVSLRTIQRLANQSRRCTGSYIKGLGDEQGGRRGGSIDAARKRGWWMFLSPWK